MVVVMLPYHSPSNSRLPLMEFPPQQQIAADDDLMDIILHRCVELLTIRDFAKCRVYAIACRKMYSRHLWPLQALAVADVLAAGKRLANGHPDWYAILLAEKYAQLDALGSNFMKLIYLLDPRANKFPFSHSAMESVMMAWRVLSDPTSKEKYDMEVAAPATFYTLCPYCHYIIEYEFVYKDLCLQCPICQKAFQAAEINSPLPKFFKFIGPDGCLMEGYYCRLGCAPLQHQMSQCVPNGFNREVEGLTCDNRSNSRDVEAMVEVHEEEEEAEPPRKRMKTTANNTEMVNETTVTNSVPLLQPQGNSVSNDSNSNSNAGEDLQLQFNGDELLLMCEAVSEETLKYVFEDD